MFIFIYIFRFIITLIFWLLFLSSSIIYAIFRPKHKNNMYIFSRIMNLYSEFVYRLNIRIIHETKELPESAIYISNHQNIIDIIVLGKSLNQNTVTMGKKSLLWVPLFGQMYWLGGNVLVDRKSSKNSHASVQDTIKRIHNEKLSIWLFPEGTRSYGKYELGKFKAGAFAMAIEAGIPIIPVCISDLSKLNKFVWKRQIICSKVLAPISTDGMTKRNIKQLMLDCHETMLHAIRELNIEAAHLNEKKDNNYVKEKISIISNEEYSKKNFNHK